MEFKFTFIINSEEKTFVIMQFHMSVLIVGLNSFHGKILRACITRVCFLSGIINFMA